jgi:hypothetical protein
MNKKYIIAMPVIAISMVIGFLGGYVYRDKKVIKFVGGMVDENRQFVGRGQGGTGVVGQMRLGFRPTSGEVLEINDKTLTLKTENGSKVIVLSDTTTINKPTTIDKTEIKVGTKLSVFGQESSDGTINANMIQLVFDKQAQATPSSSKN